MIHSYLKFKIYSKIKFHHSTKCETLSVWTLKNNSNYIVEDEFMRVNLPVVRRGHLIDVCDANEGWGRERRKTPPPSQPPFQLPHFQFVLWPPTFLPPTPPVVSRYKILESVIAQRKRYDERVKMTNLKIEMTESHFKQESPPALTRKRHTDRGIFRMGRGGYLLRSGRGGGVPTQVWMGGGLPTLRTGRGESGQVQPGGEGGYLGRGEGGVPWPDVDRETNWKYYLLSYYVRGR